MLQSFPLIKAGFSLLDSGSLNFVRSLKTPQNCSIKSRSWISMNFAPGNLAEPWFLLSSLLLVRDLLWILFQPRYKESEIYLARFRQCLSQALNHIKTYVTNILTNAMQQVQPKKVSTDWCSCTHASELMIPTRPRAEYAALHAMTWCMVVWCTQNLCRDGSSFMWHQPCQRFTPLWWIFKKRTIKSSSLM